MFSEADIINPQGLTESLKPNSQSGKTKVQTRQENYEETNRIFLTAIATGLTVKDSAQKTGKSAGCFSRRKYRDQEFAAQWEEAAKVGAEFEQSSREKFLQLLSEGIGPGDAARLAGRSVIQLNRKRRSVPDFDKAWKKAKSQGTNKKLSVLKSYDVTVFLNALRSGCSVEKAAKMLGLPTSDLYFLKSNDPDFAAQWDQALTGRRF
ncbi:MAG: hypothetical protein LBP22_00580 [Deltaproteobacteria bacterium]|nr:hypothetical protein [Deltaproteobacteria bacterium]